MRELIMPQSFTLSFFYMYAVNPEIFSSFQSSIISCLIIQPASGSSSMSSFIFYTSCFIDCVSYDRLLIVDVLTSLSYIAEGAAESCIAAEGLTETSYPSRAGLPKATGLPSASSFLIFFINLMVSSYCSSSSINLLTKCMYSGSRISQVPPNI